MVCPSQVWAELRAVARSSTPGAGDIAGVNSDSGLERNGNASDDDPPLPMWLWKLPIRGWVPFTYKLTGLFKVAETQECPEECGHIRWRGRPTVGWVVAIAKFTSVVKSC